MASGDRLFESIWDGVVALEMTGFHVRAFIADRAATNRKFFKLHRKDGHCLTYCTQNQYGSVEHCEIYFICDFLPSWSHVIQTWCMRFKRYLFGTRQLWSDTSQVLNPKAICMLSDLLGCFKAVIGRGDYDTWRAALRRAISDDSTYPLSQVRNSLWGDALSIVDGRTTIGGFLESLDDFSLKMETSRHSSKLQEFLSTQQGKGEGASQFIIRLVSLKKKIPSINRRVVG